MSKPKLTLCAEELDTVHTVLKAVLREAGPGTVLETEQALGLYRGYIRYHRHRRELDLGVLLAILKHLEISPLDFFDQVATELGDPDGSDPATDPDPEPDPEPEPEPEPDPDDDTPPGAPPDIEPLTARAVLRRLGADLPVYGDFDP